MDDVFFGPFSGASLAERRARWEAVNSPVQMCSGPRRKRRKIEESARHGRFEYEYAEGNPTTPIPGSGGPRACTWKDSSSQSYSTR